MKTKNNKPKILITAFIFTITLLIVGVSYAYFTATANNNNNQQINLETGTLSLIFSDNNNGFNVQLSPGGSAEKTFTIRNNGNKEAAASMSFVNLINTYLADSLLYSLSYSETQNGTYKYLNIDNVPTSSTRVTREISNGIIVPANTTYYYKLRIKLVNLQETDQTSDLSATMNTKFRIDAVNLPDNNGKSDQTLQKLHSLNNTITVTSGTPDFQYTNEGDYCQTFADIDHCTKEGSDVSKISNGIYAMEDDYGTSYYFRGDVSNNYVHFGGYYWRIMRINGDGTLRLFFVGPNANLPSMACVSKWNTNLSDNAYIGYMYGYEQTNNNYEVYETKSYEEAHMNKYNSTIKDNLDNWYNTNLLSQSSKIADTLFCEDRQINTNLGGLGYGTSNTVYAASYNRNNNPILKCPQKNDAFTVNDEIHGNGKLTYPIGLITLDELNIGGIIFPINNPLSYLFYNSEYWTFSPLTRDQIGVSTDDTIAKALVNEDLYVIPVINLTQEAVMSMTGSGTISDPFEA